MSDYPAQPPGADRLPTYRKPARGWRPGDLPGLVFSAIGYALVGVATVALWLVLAFPLILLAAWAITPLVSIL